MSEPLSDLHPTGIAHESPAHESLDDFLGMKPQPRWRRWLKWGIIALGLVLLILLLKSCFTAGELPNYATREVRRGDLTVTVSATGNLKPINQVDVGSEQSGLITHVYVDVNDKVTKGQVLAELDTSRLIDAVNQSKAQLASSQAAGAQAEATLAQSRATLARQEQVYRLSGGKVPAKTEMDTARADYQRARAGVNAAQANIGVAQAGLATAQTNLSKARILSPVNGVVLSRDIEPGQTVAASFNAPVLFTIAEDLQKMELQVAVDEADVGQVKQGQEASFTVDAFPGRDFPARITRVNVGSNASTASSSTTASTTGTVVAYTAELAVHNPDETLRPGMTATADIVTSRISDVLLVPNAALRFKPQAAKGGGGITSTLIPRRRFGNRATQEVNFGAGSHQTVYVLGDDGKPAPVEVVIGQSDGSRTQITSGELKPGMKIVTGQLAAGQTAPNVDNEGGAGNGQHRNQGQRRGAGGAAGGNGN